MSSKCRSEEEGLTFLVGGAAANNYRGFEVVMVTADQVK